MVSSKVDCPPPENKISLVLFPHHWILKLLSTTAAPQPGNPTPSPN